MDKVFDINGRQIIQNKGQKYSELLEEFLNPFVKELEYLESPQIIIEVGILAWNMGNEELLNPIPDLNDHLLRLTPTKKEAKLISKMITYKKENFSAYDMYIADFELVHDDPKKAPILRVLTQTREEHLRTVEKEINEEFYEEENLEIEGEGITDRIAIVIKAKQPFLDWYRALYPNDEFEDLDKETTTVYLVNDEVYDIEKWLKKKYDTLFKLQLEDWHLNKKEWPQKRNYKLFKAWFNVSISDMVYDLEKTPVYKE